MTKKMGWNATSASLWMASPRLGQIDMLDGRTTVQRSLSRLEKPADKNLKKFKDQSKNLHLGQNNYHTVEGDYSPLFRSYLAYCAKFWAPQKKEDFDKLEQIKQETIKGPKGKDA